MGVIIPHVVSEDSASGAQVIDGGLRFDSSKSHYLSRIPASATNRRTWTLSFWIKRSSNATYQMMFQAGNANNVNEAFLYFVGDGISFFQTDGSGNTAFSARPTGVFRDYSAWYHIVLKYDSTQATSTDRVRYYINGVDRTDTSTSFPSLNFECTVNSTDTHRIGTRFAGIQYLGAYIQNFQLIDGQALDASYFGYTDPLTNTWRPKKLDITKTPGGSWGTNGFYLPFDGSAPIGQDQSGRGNNWTPVNFGGSASLEKATGALPILNTDGGGKVARVGVRTDAFASNLVLALPLVGIKSDFSNAINSGTSNKTITDSNVTYSSSYGNFYGASGSFNGSSSYLNTSGLSINASTFTVEFWINFNAFNGVPVMTSTSSRGGIGIYFPNSSTLNFVGGTASGSWNIDTNITVALTTGTWYHFACVRSAGGTFDIYKDGVLLSSLASVSITHGELSLGRQGGDNNLYFNGYIQDLRIYSGVAKYTSNFIPASTDPDIVPDSPSGVSYSSNLTQITEGAVVFDGTGDYLEIAASSDFALGTNDWTVEYFAYPTSTTQYQRHFYLEAPGNSSNIDGIFADSSGIAFGRTNVWGATAVSNPLNQWNHYALVHDSTNMRLYINGVQVQTSTDNFGTDATKTLRIGYSNISYGGYFTGFISNFHVVKGTALYTANFTPPSAPISSVANTKLLCCKSNSSAISADVTPGTITANGNAAATNFNPFTANINTQRGKQSGYATLNPLNTGGSAITFSNGNLNFSATGTGRGVSTISMKSGKWYCEMLSTSSAQHNHPGIYADSISITTDSNRIVYRDDGNIYRDGSLIASIASFTTGDLIGMSFDADNRQLTYYKNGIFVGGPYTATDPGFGNGFYFHILTGSSSGCTGSFNFGQKPFKFPPPPGFQPLTLANLPRPTIVRPDQYMGIVTYTGTGAARNISIGWKPDFVWIKERATSERNHQLFDTVRGPSKTLFSNTTSAEDADITDALTSFNFDGFTLGGRDRVNNLNGSYVAWAWKAGGNSNTFNINDIGYSTASAAGLTAGTIAATGSSVNTKTGFSIIKYRTSGGGTVPHGLNQAPEVSIAKRMNGTGDWYFRVNIGSINGYLLLNTQAAVTSSFSVTSTTVQGADFGTPNEDWILYNWHSIPGFSKFGSYTGNGSSDGTTVITGFKPAMIIIKRTDSTNDWGIFDTTRNKYNLTDLKLFPNSSGAENSLWNSGENNIDILSNGFKLRTANAGTNTGTYIYCAWAESPTINLYGAQANAR